MKKNGRGENAKKQRKHSIPTNWGIDGKCDGINSFVFHVSSQTKKVMHKILFQYYSIIVNQT